MHRRHQVILIKINDSFISRQKLKCPEPILIIVGGYQDSWNINARLFVNKQEIILNKR